MQLSLSSLTSIQSTSYTAPSQRPFAPREQFPTAENLPNTTPIYAIHRTLASEQNQNKEMLATMNRLILLTSKRGLCCPFHLTIFADAVLHFVRYKVHEFPRSPTGCFAAVIRARTWVIAAVQMAQFWRLTRRSPVFPHEFYVGRVSQIFDLADRNKEETGLSNGIVTEDLPSVMGVEHRLRPASTYRTQRRISRSHCHVNASHNPLDGVEISCRRTEPHHRI